MAQQEVQNGGASAEKKAVSFTALKTQLVVEAPKASDAVSFYKAAFGAEELGRAFHPKRKADQELPLLIYAQLSLAGATFLVSDSTEDSPAAVKTAGSGCLLCLETDDVEGAMANAVSAGAVAEGQTVDGDGACCGGGLARRVKDPYGFTWVITSPVGESGRADAEV